MPLPVTKPKTNLPRPRQSLPTPGNSAVAHPVGRPRVSAPAVLSSRPAQNLAGSPSKNAYDDSGGSASVAPERAPSPAPHPLQDRLLLTREELLVNLREANEDRLAKETKQATTTKKAKKASDKGKATAAKNLETAMQQIEDSDDEEQQDEEQEEWEEQEDEEGLDTEEERELAAEAERAKKRKHQYALHQTQAAKEAKRRRNADQFLTALSGDPTHGLSPDALLAQCEAYRRGQENLRLATLQGKMLLDLSHASLKQFATVAGDKEAGTDGMVLKLSALETATSAIAESFNMIVAQQEAVNAKMKERVKAVAGTLQKK